MTLPTSNGGLNYVDTFSKITRLQCSLLRKLCDENFHENGK